MKARMTAAVLMTAAALSCSKFEQREAVRDLGFEVATEVAFNSEYLSNTLSVRLDSGTEGAYVLNYIIDTLSTVHLTTLRGNEVESGDKCDLSLKNPQLFLLPKLSGDSHTLYMEFEREGVSRRDTVTFKTESAVAVRMDCSEDLDFTRVILSNRMGSSLTAYEVTFYLDGDLLSGMKYLGSEFLQLADHPTYVVQRGDGLLGKRVKPCRPPYDLLLDLPVTYAPDQGVHHRHRLVVVRGYALELAREHLHPLVHPLWHACARLLPAAGPSPAPHVNDARYHEPRYGLVSGDGAVPADRLHVGLGKAHIESPALQLAWLFRCSHTLDVKFFYGQSGLRLRSGPFIPPVAARKSEPPRTGSLEAQTCFTMTLLARHQVSAFPCGCLSDAVCPVGKDI